MSIHLPQPDNADAWQLAIWNAADDFLSRPQKLQLMLLLECRFNLFHPFTVVRALLEHRRLWHGAVMTRGFLNPEAGRFALSRFVTNLIELRDIGGGHWNVDTLMIHAAPGSEVELRTLAENWRADEIDWIDGEDADGLLGVFGAGDQKLLRVWWD